MQRVRPDHPELAMTEMSPLHLCNYLPDRAARLEYVSIDSPNLPHNPHTLLNHLGFRRSGNVLYRPRCHHCMQCITARVPVADFIPSSRFRRVLKRNQTVSQRMIPSSQATAEHYALYASYIHDRHADGDMYPPSLHTFEHYLVYPHTDSYFIEFRGQYDKLIGVAVTDVLEDGCSAVYTFFDSSLDMSQRSLGIFCILSQMAWCRLLQRKYLYLGYWIPTVKKMAYKTDFTPIELLINDQWYRFDSTPDTEVILGYLDSLKR